MIKANKNAGNWRPDSNRTEVKRLLIMARTGESFTSHPEDERLIITQRNSRTSACTMGFNRT